MSPQSYRDLGTVENQQSMNQIHGVHTDRREVLMDTGVLDPVCTPVPAPAEVFGFGLRSVAAQ